MKKNSTIALMFSGGIDSAYTAVCLSRTYECVHLLTYTNGYGHYHIDRAARRAEEIRSKTAGRFVHAVISIRELFDMIVLDSIKADYVRYGSGFIWCLGCKIAMHTQSILYCLENKIPAITDGSSRETDEMVEQMPPSLACITGSYNTYYIDFLSPEYNVRRDEKITFLSKAGFKTGIRIGDRFMGIQPVCIPGELYYLPYLLFNKPLNHDEKNVCSYIHDKLKHARTYIDTYAHSAK